MSSKRYPGLIPGSPEYIKAATMAYRKRLAGKLGVTEYRRRLREGVRKSRARDVEKRKRPELDPDTLARMNASLDTARRTA